MERKSRGQILQLKTREISYNMTWTWLRKGNLKREIKSLLITPQNNAIKTNQIKVKIDNTQRYSKCVLCEGTVNYIMSEYITLGKDCKTRHDWVGKVIHWELSKKLKYDHTTKHMIILPNFWTDSGSSIYKQTRISPKNGAHKIL